MKGKVQSPESPVLSQPADNNFRQASQSRSQRIENPNCSQQLTTPLHSDTTSQREGDPARVASSKMPLALKAIIASPSQNMPRAFLKSFLYWALIWQILFWSSISLSRLVSESILWLVESRGFSRDELILAAFTIATALMTAITIFVTFDRTSFRSSMPVDSASAASGGQGR